MATRSSSKSKSRSERKKAERERPPIGRVAALGVLLFSVAGLGSAVVGALPVSPGDNSTPVVAGTDEAEEDDTSSVGDLAGAQVETAEIPENGTAQAAPPRLGAYQELVDLDGWINSDATNLSSFDGQVRIVKFWTFGCINCKNTLPHLREIYSRWEPQGLEIIGVHSPEFDYERDPVAIQQATVDQNIPWPVALDTEKKNFRSWQGSRRFWPRTYVIDQSGDIRYDHIGEGKYDELEATVAYLIQNPGA